MTGTNSELRGAPVPTTTLQTVDRALTFMETVATSPTPLSIRDIAKQLEVNLTTCYHLFNTLSARGYVERNPDLTLRIGRQIAGLYDGYQRGFSTQQQMNDFVLALARDTLETAWLSSLVIDSVVLTAFADGPQAVRATGLHVGLSGLEHARSSGRAVLAYLNEERRERVLEKALSNIPPSQHPAIIARLGEDLQQIRERGWAVDDQEYSPGIMGIAAPYFSAGGDVLGAVGVWAPAPRARDGFDRLVEQVRKAGEEATAVFGRTH